MAKLETGSRDETIKTNEDVSTFTQDNYGLLLKDKGGLYGDEKTEYVRLEEKFNKYQDTVASVVQKVELNGLVDKTSRDKRGDVTLKIAKDGRLRLESWGMNWSFTFLENKTGDKFAISGYNDRFPVKSFEHAVQIANLGNSIAASALDAAKSLGNKEYLILSQNASPVEVVGDKIIFKGTVNNTTLYTGSGGFLPPGFAEVIVKSVNSTINRSVR